MIKAPNPTLQKFLEQLIKAFKDENEMILRGNGKSDFVKEIDIPFMISSLYQKLNRNPSHFHKFIDDLENHPDWNISIEQPKNSEYKAAVARIDYYDLGDLENNWTGFYYILTFYYDDRLFGYCQCTPDMPDYREDKHCCGHGCDAVFCTFTLEKVSYVTAGTWDGDEHDYWNFEDEFYKSENELREKKELEEYKREVQRLKYEIENASKKLNKLISVKNHSV